MLQFTLDEWRAPSGNPVSWRVQAGEVWKVGGPSGSGKSTLLGVLVGLKPVLSGTLLWSGVSPPEDRRAQVARVAQAPQFTQSQVIGALLAPFSFKAQRARGVSFDPGRCNQELADLGLPALSSFGGRSVDTLSGGERMRLALVRTLLLNPQALLLDEPTASLDDQATDLVCSRLERFRDQGRDRGFVILATHDPRIAGLADRSLNLK